MSTYLFMLSRYSLFARLLAILQNYGILPLVPVIFGVSLSSFLPSSCFFLHTNAGARVLLLYKKSLIPTPWIQRGPNPTSTPFDVSLNPSGGCQEKGQCWKVISYGLPPTTPSQARHTPRFVCVVWFVHTQIKGWYFLDTVWKWQWRARFLGWDGDGGYYCTRYCSNDVPMTIGRYYGNHAMDRVRLC